jgi:hypothetical protein
MNLSQRSCNVKWIVCFRYVSLVFGIWFFMQNISLSFRVRTVN